MHDYDVRRRARVAALLLVALSPACLAPGLTRERVDKVQLGMTEADVQKLLGKPGTITDMKYAVPPGEGGPSSPFGKMYVYTEGITFAQIYFEDGRVFGVRYNNEFLKGDFLGEQDEPPTLPQNRPS